MSETTERPEMVEDAHLTYLDRLREDGVTNMFGAGPYLAELYELDPDAARTVLAYWMKTFGQEER